MRTLKESILDDMENTMSKGDKLVDIAAKKELEKEIYKTGIYTVGNEQLYQKIYDYCTKTTDKKGSRWRLIVPCYEKVGDNLKPLMVSISAKKAFYREPDEKELYDTTGSAMNKRLKKVTDKYSRLNLSNCFLSNYDYDGFKKLLYFMNEFKFIGDVAGVSNDSWYTIGLTYFNKSHGYERQHIEYVSFNYDTKEWGWGYNGRIPKSVIGSTTLYNVWEIISKNVLYSDTPATKTEGVYQLTLTKMNIANIKNLKLAQGDVMDAVANTPKNWVRIGIKEDHGKPVTTHFYISKDGKSIVWDEDIKAMFPNKNEDSSYNIKKEITAIKGYRYNQASISDELDSYIKKNYKKVSSYDDSQRWFKVHKAGNDAKYGSYMVCFDTKEWRGKTFDEFYGGGIVD